MNYGFVYIWRDRKHNRYYIGSHWGTENDGYICSSNWMRDSFRRRPLDFKRRIVSRISTNRVDLLVEEHRWLAQIKDDEIGKRYYNLRKSFSGPGAFTVEQRRKLSESKIGKKTGPRSKEVREKISLKQRGRVFSEEHKQRLSAARKKRVLGPTSEKTKKKMSLSQAGRVFSEEHKQRLREAWAKRKLCNDT